MLLRVFKVRLLLQDRVRAQATGLPRRETDEDVLPRDVGWAASARVNTNVDNVSVD